MKSLILLALILLVSILVVSETAAQPHVVAAGMTLAADTGGVVIRWAADSTAFSSQAIPTLPAPQLIALYVPDDVDLTPQISAVHTTAWAGDLPAASAPLAMLREGHLRGRRIVVYALSPVFLDEHGPTRLLSLEARISSATPLRAADAWIDISDTAFLASAPDPAPIASQQAWVIQVDHAGVQSLSAATLQSAGLNLSSVDPANLWLWRAGVAVPLERLISGSALSELRFYAPEPGDRYNSTDTYWLTVESTAGAVMQTADARPTSGSPGLTSTALARGTWRTRTFYEPRLPGPDDDHFFAGELKTGQTSTIATLSPTLPQMTGSVTLTVTGASLIAATHTLNVTLAGVVKSTNWSGSGIFSRSLSFASSAGSQAKMTLIPSTTTDSIDLDSVAWELPVQLSFSQRGAAFVGYRGYWRYLLSNIPPSAAIYDVSDPDAPVRLTMGTSSFEVNTTESRSYVLTGLGTLYTPVISAHTPVDLKTPLNAQAIYIVPDAFVTALDPLVSQREAQGYSVAVVRAEAIYDAWSGGQVSPQAIRDFLRYAAATWSVKPIAVTLVGDGTSDPRNYMGIGQTSWIPPYLEQVDPDLGETACENCFAQLDGDSPLDDWLPDLMLGRLPVKSAAELHILAQKIIAYEASQEVGAWRGRMGYLADNTDAAGDFAYTADQSITSLPDDVTTTRIYYDPEALADESWQISDSYAVFEQTMGLFNRGAAVVSFLGHGSLYQWAYTGLPLDPDVPQDRQYFLNVDFAGDLTNGTRLPIVLSMTCLTGAFQQPSVRGTTVDEALLLNPNGGAIATWSSAGLGVLYGHDALQRGFLNALWSAPAGSSPRLGTLTMAGYQELFTASSCCQESLRTYSLLGDPLTPAAVRAGSSEVVLPFVHR
ncbi:MAG: hypothetical protein HGA19_07565 [Oscillochloris sp.]|nr:hypothetical protein [Oscillochloris sp.]